MIYRRDVGFIIVHLFPVGVVSIVGGVIAAVAGNVIAGMIGGETRFVWTVVSPFSSEFGEIELLRSVSNGRKATPSLSERAPIILPGVLHMT